jgi:hypothetical protein
MKTTPTTTHERPPEDVAFERYDFGIGVTVEGTNGWSRDSASPEVTRTVFVRYDEDAPGADTRKLHFTAILEAGEVQDAWASDDKGQQIGHFPRPGSRLNLR